MNVDEIVNLLRKWVPEFEKRFRAQVKGVFGSHARRQERPDSEIDLLVLFDEEADLLDYAGLCRELEERLRRRVHVAPLDTIPAGLKNAITKETVYL